MTITNSINHTQGSVIYPTSATQGDILYASAANTISDLAKDTNATRYLSNTGTSNNPAWAQVNLADGVTGALPQANGGSGVSNFSGNKILLGTLTPSSAATADFNNLITSTYDVYEVEFYAVIPSSGTNTFKMQVGTGVTPTWDTGANYGRAGMDEIASSPTFNGDNASGETSWIIWGDPTISTSNGVSGRLIFYNLTSTAVVKNFIKMVVANSGSGTETLIGSGSWATSGTAVSSLRFFFGANNITSGTLKLYGIVK